MAHKERHKGVRLAFIWTDPELKERFAKHCAERERTMSDVIRDLITDTLDNWPADGVETVEAE